MNDYNKTIKRRSPYPSAKQKKKLMSMMAQHPQLISHKISQDFNQTDYIRLWEKISNQLNSYQGAKKTWQQWRKTWHDLRSKFKKRQSGNGPVPQSIQTLTESEREALGWKNVSSTTSVQEQEELEFVSPEDESSHGMDFFNADEAISEPESPKTGVKQEIIDIEETSRKTTVKNHRHNNSTCEFNCERLAIQEERKISIKEDYLSFKKEYLRQKLQLMKEQVEALKQIATNVQPNVVRNI